jgi:hypothetical protein
MENLNLQNSATNPTATTEAVEERSMFRHALPLAAPLISACLFIAAAQIPFIIDEGRTEALLMAASALVVVNAGAARYMTRDWRFGAPPSILAMGGFGYLLLAGNPMGRYLVIAGVVGLLAVFFTFLEKGGVSDSGVKPTVSADYGRLSLMMIAPGAFFLYAFGFALIEHQVLGRWLTTLLAAFLSAFLSWEALHDLAADSKTVRMVIGVAAVLGTQFFLALAFLPINHLVNAAVLAIVLSIVLQRSRDALKSVRDAAAFRRQVALSLLLIILILVTAQWL